MYRDLKQHACIGQPQATKMTRNSVQRSPFDQALGYAVTVEIIGIRYCTEYFETLSQALIASENSKDNTGHNTKQSCNVRCSMRDILILESLLFPSTLRSIKSCRDFNNIYQAGDKRMGRIVLVT